MESPYYEMTHDFEEENRLFQSGYVKGYHDAVMKYPAIVRCKDCKYCAIYQHYEGDISVCARMYRKYVLFDVTADKDFCSKAERRDTER